MDLDKGKLYRFPWSMNDNPIGWLEVTDICNIHCKGCYRQKLEGHKTLEAIKEEVLFLKKWRNCDNISIAGGEPLVHPQIVDIVRFISDNGIKPFLLTNGKAMTRERLADLAKAGLVGVEFHVDQWQEQEKWRGKNEVELCALREQFADMVYDVAKIPCHFNITVYKENFPYIPDLVKWSVKNSKKVQGFVFITYRAAILQPGRDYYVDGEKITLDESTLGYATQQDAPEDIGIEANDVYKLIKKEFPEYEPAGYLGGSRRHDSFKWVIGLALCSNGKLIGAMGNKGMELSQTMHHFFNKTYLLYMHGRSVGRKVFLLAPIDRRLRRGFGKWLSNPLNLFRPLRSVGIGIIQAPDVLGHGEVDMCDSCPDMTFFEGRLVNSCRLDEYRKFGAAMTPEEKAPSAPASKASQ